jgi:hypothetical protein
MTRWLPGRSGTSLCAGALVAVVLPLCGCSLLGSSHATELRGAAASLLPPRSRVIKQSLTDCVELESSPSCRLIYFVAPRQRTSALARNVQMAAKRDGWSLTRKDVYDGGTELRLKRHGLRAYVSLAAGTRAEACRQKPHEGCASFINVSVD